MVTRITFITLIFTSLFATDSSLAAPSHAIAMHGDPALPADFTSLPYANADAPQGGDITFGERGSFDTLNPFTVKGRAPWILRTHVFESLMARSWDEPFTLYGLLAESVETDAGRSWAEFTLNPKAAFSTGASVTAGDVVFSLETLRNHGQPNMRAYYKRVASVATPGEGRIRFTFDAPDRELPLLLGLMPILSKADWQGKDFTRTTLTPPVGSGPYRVADVTAGEALMLDRRDDYWGKDLPVRRGTHTIDRATLLYFRDDNARWEAFTAGLVDLREETDPARWEDGYDFPAAGGIARDEIAHGRATGMDGFAFNTRRSVFADRRVREALTHAFDFEWTNAALNRGAFERITSYFGNSDFAFSGPSEGAERALLEPFADVLPPGTLDSGYALPVSPGDGRNRQNMRTAARLLREAGWQVSAGKLVDKAGKQMRFEILLNTPEDEKVAAAFAQSLRRLGIDASLRMVESAQYQERLNAYDFDMIVRLWRLSLSPGAEQRFYFGSEGVTREGTRNYMGADNPAIDAMIEAMLDRRDTRSIPRGRASAGQGADLGALRHTALARTHRPDRMVENAGKTRARSALRLSPGGMVEQRKLTKIRTKFTAQRTVGSVLLTISAHFFTCAIRGSPVLYRRRGEPAFVPRPCVLRDPFQRPASERCGSSVFGAARSVRRSLHAPCSRLPDRRRPAFPATACRVRRSAPSR